MSICSVKPNSLWATTSCYKHVYIAIADILIAVVDVLIPKLKTYWGLLVTAFKLLLWALEFLFKWAQSLTYTYVGISKCFLSFIAQKELGNDLRTRQFNITIRERYAQVYNQVYLLFSPSYWPIATKRQFIFSFYTSLFFSCYTCLLRDLNSRAPG